MKAISAKGGEMRMNDLNKRIRKLCDYENFWAKVKGLGESQCGQGNM